MSDEDLFLEAIELLNRVYAGLDNLRGSVHQRTDELKKARDERGGLAQEEAELRARISKLKRTELDLKTAVRALKIRREDLETTCSELESRCQTLENDLHSPKRLTRAGRAEPSNRYPIRSEVGLREYSPDRKVWRVWRSKWAACGPGITSRMGCCR